MEEDSSLIPESILKSLVLVHNQLFGSRDLVEHVSSALFFFPFTEFLCESSALNMVKALPRISFFHIVSKQLVLQW